MDTAARHPAGGKMQAVAELGATLLLQLHARARGARTA